KIDYKVPKHPVAFKTGNTEFNISAIIVPTLISNITFYVLNSPILFLLLLKNMDALSIYFNNTRNKFVKHNGTRVRIIKRFGYPWFFFNASIYVINKISMAAKKKIAGFLFLIKTELRRVYKRFNYLFVNKLHKTFQRASYNTNCNALEIINKICYEC
ncbi:hypothetical protein GGTG_02261, partial [Gaeumannomyces tritici R3-111a-1]